MRVEATTCAAIIGAPEFADLAAAYTAESRIAGMPDASAKLSTYEALEKLGIIHPFAAWDGERLIGFIGLLTNTVPHYSAPLACIESFFVARDDRASGAGLALLKAAEAKAREIGASGLLVSAPAGGRLERVLPRYGYRDSSHTFFKRFHDA